MEKRDLLAEKRDLFVLTKLGERHYPHPIRVEAVTAPLTVLDHGVDRWWGIASVRGQLRDQVSAAMHTSAK